MAAVYCEHHAKVPARWRCGHCHKNLCVHCAPKGVREEAPSCPTCREQLQSLGMGNLIKPFWQRIPRFFAYPFKANPLITALGLSLLSLAKAIPLVGIAAAIAVTVYTLRYSYRVLYFTALGNLEPPEGEQGGDMKGMFIKQTALFIILFGGVGLIGGLTRSMLLTGIAFGGAMLLLPAAVMTLAIESSLLAAINPLKLMFVAVSVGWPYLLLWVMLTLLFGGDTTLMVMVGPHLPLLVLLFVSTFVSVYFTIAMFHMMGYVVYQYHEPLGFGAMKEYSDSDEGAKDLNQAAAASPAVDRAQMLITDGRFEEAEAELTARIGEAPDDLKPHDRYNRLVLAREGSAERGTSHADLYIGKLLALKQNDKALEVYRRSIAAWKTLEIKDANETVTLARHALARNDAKSALPMLARFAQRFPGHAAIPEATLLSAQVLSTGLGKDQMALQLVEQLRRTHPQHALRPQMDALHGTLTRLLARQAPRASA